MIPKPTVRNLYTALRFVSRPDLHLTLRYYPDVQVRGEFEAELVQAVGVFWANARPQPFMLELTERAMFGPRRNIPVLLATGGWPTWVEPLRLVVPVKAKDNYGFRPHVTTDEGPMTLEVTSIAVMHKKEAIWSWELA